MSTSSSDTDYVPNEHADFDEYGSFVTPSEIMPYSYHASFINQNEIYIELSCKQAHLAPIVSLTSTKMLTNMIHLQHRLR